MALKVTEKPYVTDIEEGTHLAVCVGIFDVGTVKSPVYGTEQEKVVFLFEFPDMIDGEGWPKTIKQEFTASLDKKAKLHAFITSWRGKSFQAGEKDGFDLKPFLGRAGYLQVIHNNGSGDKSNNVYANVGTVTGLRPSDAVPKPSRNPLYFDFSEGKARIPEGTPEFVERMIVAAPEWQAIKMGRPLTGPKSTAKAPPKQQAPAEIIEHLNEIGLAFPYDREELDAKFPADGAPEVYDLLVLHEIPF